MDETHIEKLNQPIGVLFMYIRDSVKYISNIGNAVGLTNFPIVKNKN